MSSISSTAFNNLWLYNCFALFPTDRVAAADNYAWLLGGTQIEIDRWLAYLIFVTLMQ